MLSRSDLDRLWEVALDCEDGSAFDSESGWTFAVYPFNMVPGYGSCLTMLREHPVARRVDRVSELVMMAQCDEAVPKGSLVEVWEMAKEGRREEFDHALLHISWWQDRIKEAHDLDKADRAGRGEVA